MGPKNIGISKSKKTDVTNRVFLRIYELEKVIEKMASQLKETRAMVSMLLACKDIFIKRGTLTDDDIKEEIQKYFTNTNQKSDKGSNTEDVGPRIVDNNDDGLSETEQDISSDKSDRESKDGDA